MARFMYIVLRYAFSFSGCDSCQSRTASRCRAMSAYGICLGALWKKNLLTEGLHLLNVKSDTEGVKVGVESDTEGVKVVAVQKQYEKCKSVVYFKESIIEG